LETLSKKRGGVEATEKRKLGPSLGKVQEGQASEGGLEFLKREENKVKRDTEWGLNKPPLLSSRKKGSSSAGEDTELRRNPSESPKSQGQRERGTVTPR